MINHFALFGDDNFIIFGKVQHFSGGLVIFYCGSGSLHCQKIGHPGIDPGCCQHIHLTFLYHIHNAAYCGDSQDHGDPSHKIGQVWDYKGYLVLIIALDSVYLNPYDDIANWSSEGISQSYTGDLTAYEV